MNTLPSICSPRPRGFQRTIRAGFPAFLLLGLIWAVITGCTSTGIPPSEATSLPTPALFPTNTPQPESPANPLPPGSLTLRIWVPPAFDPAAGTAAASLFQDRLDQFAGAYPEVTIEVRVKAASGPGGLLDSLSAAQAVAPDGLPGLIALPRAALEAAAIKGLIYPFKSPDLGTDEDWYPFAVDLARVQGEQFGVPFAGDALVMVYRPDEIEIPPQDWASTVNTGSPLLFAAGSPQALTTLTLYQAAGGIVEDDQGRPVIRSNALTAVLNFYQDAQQAGVMPEWLVDLTTDQEVLQALGTGQGAMAVTHISTFLNTPPDQLALSILPTPGSAPFTLVDGWVWALSNPDEQLTPFSLELVRFLTAGDYLADWTAAAGFLPPRPSALAAWPESSLQAFASRITLSAQLIPSLDVVNSLGPVIQQAVVSVLGQFVEPAVAAQRAAERLSSP